MILSWTIQPHVAPFSSQCKRYILFWKANVCTYFMGKHFQPVGKTMECTYFEHGVDKVAVKLEHSNATMPICYCLPTQRCVRASIECRSPLISAPLCPCFYMHSSSWAVINRRQVVNEQNMTPWLGNSQIKVYLRLVFVQQWKVTDIQFPQML